MTNTEIDIDERAANLFIKEKRSAFEIKKILLNDGFDSTVIEEVSNRIKKLELVRVRNAILRGITFVFLGLLFYVIRANYGSNYGRGIDYVGLIAIVYGIYKIIKAYHKRLCIKREMFSR